MDDSGIRALQMDVPPKVLDYLTALDNEPVQFLELLQHWYRSPEQNVWWADWSGFHFPYADPPPPDPTLLPDSELALNLQSGWGGPSWDFKFARFLRLNLVSTRFEGLVDCRGTTIEGPATIVDSTFEGVAEFTRARFLGGLSMERTTFESRAAFDAASFSGVVSISSSTFKEGFGNSQGVAEEEFVMSNCNVNGTVNWWEAKLGGYVSIRHCTIDEVRLLSSTLGSGGSLGQSKIQRVEMTSTVVAKALDFSLDTSSGGVVELHQVGSERTAFGEARYPSELRFGPMSLARVSMSDMSASTCRLQGARDIDKLALFDVHWSRKGKGNHVADEWDLSGDNQGGPTPSEVERIYRALRKNSEDQSDRVASHGWYYSEMEIGRRYSPVFSLRRLARQVYKTTSGYGLSAVRPLVVLLCVAAAVLAVFLWSGSTFWCPVATGPNTCVGAGSSVVVVLRALTFQQPPDGVSIVGVGANLLWLATRLVGASMLVFIGIAFRNQVAR